MTDHEFQIKVTASLERIESTLSRSTSDIDSIKHTLYGNGKDGLVTIVDRNTNSIKQAKWLVMSILVVIIGLVINSIWNRVNQTDYVNFKDEIKREIHIERDAKYNEDLRKFIIEAINAGRQQTPVQAK